MITDVEYIVNDRASRRLNKARRRAEEKAERQPAPRRKASPLAPKNEGQRAIFDSIEKNDLTLINGPSGVGKSYIAARLGLKSVLSGQHNKLVLTRSTLAMDGDELGFLPGGINDKLMPWMLPLVNAFADELHSKAEVQKLLDIGKIEFLALQFAQGMSYNNSFFICDESQNLTREQYRVLVTRLGEGTKAVFLGDTEQSAFKERQNGLDFAIELLIKYNLPDGLVELTSEDIVRSELVRRWVEVFESNEDFSVDNPA